MKSEIRIVIADDHPVFRQGLRQVLEREKDIKVVAEAENGEQALEEIRRTLPDVAVLDIDMPRLDGLAAARAVREGKLKVEIVFLTMHKDERLLNESIHIGAKGYVLKESAVTDIVGSVRAAAEGRDFISSALSTFLISRRRRADALNRSKPGLEKLTPSERRILLLLADNKTNKEIAAELFVSVRTVENHRANMAVKLDLHGSHALLRFAIENKSELS